MDSYIETQFLHHHHQDQNHHQQANSGLLRFRSAPSSLLNEYTQGLGRFGDDELSESSYETKPPRLNLNSRNGFSVPVSGSVSSQLPPQYPKVSTTTSSCSIQRSNSLGLDQSTRPGIGGAAGGGGGGGLNLNRQSSSPAGFFNNLMSPQNGYTIMRGLGNFRVGNGTDGESSPRTSRLNMGHLPLIPEIGDENIKETSPEDLKFRNHEDDSGFDSPTGFSFASWNESGSEGSHLSENGGLPSRPNVLAHHLSLPKTSNEMAAVEKLLHFHDTVPWKVRAKRGCATHPRSIAERVRRNRISERMRKLQELVPNMDKQTNTADMLDLAVDYIKNLQDEYKVLNDNRAKCKCVNLQQSTRNQAP